MGLSNAFNYLYQIREFDNEDIFIYFDQDSDITENYIQQLVDIYKEAKIHNSKIGCLGPVYYNTSNGMVEIQKRKKEIEEGVFSVTSIITSSMLIEYSVLKEICFWNSNVFLDLADWD